RGSPVRAAQHSRIPRDHRSLTSRRQPLHRRGRRVRSFPVAALRRFPARLAGGAVSENENEAHRYRERCAWTAAADAVATLNSQLSTFNSQLTASGLSAAAGVLIERALSHGRQAAAE